MGLTIGYILKKLQCRFVSKKRGYEIMNDYFRRGGASIGKNCAILSNLDLCSEKELISIGDDVTVSGEVLFVTHDAAMPKYCNHSGALFGKITIGNRCFIGKRAMILYGVTLADNTLVAAGAVVTKSVLESGKIIGGNPARVIGTIDSFVERQAGNRMKLTELTEAIRNNDERLIQR